MYVQQDCEEEEGLAVFSHCWSSCIHALHTPDIKHYSLLICSSSTSLFSLVRVRFCPCLQQPHTETGVHLPGEGEACVRVACVKGAASVCPLNRLVCDDAEAEEKSMPLPSSSCKSYSCMFYFRIELRRGCETGAAMS